MGVLVNTLPFCAFFIHLIFSCETGWVWGHTTWYGTLCFPFSPSSFYLILEDFGLLSTALNILRSVCSHFAEIVMCVLVFYHRCSFYVVSKSRENVFIGTSKFLNFPITFLKISHWGCCKLHVDNLNICKIRSISFSPKIVSLIPHTFLIA